MNTYPFSRTIKKSVIALLILHISSHSIFAQENQQYKVPIENSKDKKLVLTNFKGDLSIDGYDGNEIIVITEAAKKTENSDLKTVYPNDNTGIGLDVEKDGNSVVINCVLPINKHKEFFLKVPYNIALKISLGCEKTGDLNINNMKGEIEASNCQDINLKKVAGPLVLSTISGDINAVFDESTNGPVSISAVNGDVNLSLATIKSKEPLSVSSVSGDINVTMPAKTSATLSMNTVSGDVNTNFELTQEKDKAQPTDDKTKFKSKVTVGAKMKSNINGGGVEINLVTVSGDINLRKGN